MDISRIGIKAGRLTALLLALVFAGLLGMGAGAEPAWPEETEGQKMLKAYVEIANGFLQEQGEGKINSLFEAYTGFEVFGITSQPDSVIPEGVEITAKLFPTSINSLEVRVNYIPRFPQVAAAFIRALTPESMSMQEALEEPTRKAKRAQNNPEDSFEDEVEELNGTMPYVYYAYYPNQYSDGVDWIQMTIIFPLSGYWDGIGIGKGETATKGPDTYSGADQGYEGYFSRDDYSHYEYFTTPTPEPDSAAGDGFPVP